MISQQIADLTFYLSSFLSTCFIKHKRQWQTNKIVVYLQTDYFKNDNQSIMFVSKVEKEIQLLCFFANRLDKYITCVVLDVSLDIDFSCALYWQIFLNNVIELNALLGLR